MTNQMSRGFHVDPEAFDMGRITSITRNGVSVERDDDGFTVARSDEGRDRDWLLVFLAIAILAVLSVITVLASVAIHRLGDQRVDVNVEVVPVGVVHEPPSLGA